MGNNRLEDNGLREELQRNLKIKNNKSVTQKKSRFSRKSCYRSNADHVITAGQQIYSILTRVHYLKYCFNANFLSGQ